jgi:hypothetical protein
MVDQSIPLAKSPITCEVFYDAKRGGSRYHVEPATTTVTKIVELPKSAINVKITDKEPKSAMSVE